MESAQKSTAPPPPVLTMDEIKNMIATGVIQQITTDVIATGELVDDYEKKIPYTVHYGWDIAKCLSCDNLWSAFNFQLIEYIRAQKFDAEKLKETLEKIQVDDHHWKWFNKSLARNGESYHWFFVVANKEPQAACLVFHPKGSAFEEREVYYIDYIAIAPWNRENPMSKRRFKGLGSLLVKEIIRYLATTKKLGFGFSLHSLPKAEGFYQHIGMVGHMPFDKDGLKYFEMKESSSKLYMVKK